MKRHRRLTSSIIILAAVLGLLISSLSAAVTVKTKDRTQRLGSLTQNGVVYISLSELTEIIGGDLDWEVLGQKVRYSAPGISLGFMIGSPYMNYSDSVYNIVYPALFREGQLYVAAETTVPYLDQALARQITWDADLNTLKIETEFFNVTDISFSPKANGLLVEILMTENLHFDLFLSSGNWVNVSIRDARLNTAKLLSKFDKKLMSDLQVHQETGVGQVSFQLRHDIKNHVAKLATNPSRIQISIPDLNFSPETFAASAQAPGDAPATKSGKEFDKEIDVIVIDAGHGGNDFGAIGRGRTREKDVTLAIARELEKQVRKDKRFRVVMTRNSDRTVSLQERAEIANKAGADLFISIHANANPSRKARGWNVFFLAPAKNDSARAVEQLENSYFIRDLAGLNDEDATEEEGDGPSDDDPLVGILNDMLMTEFQTESEDLAVMIARQFRGSLGIPSRGVDQAGFFVLNKVFTPSVLVESAFISNAIEEKLLKQPDFQTKVATGIFEAIKEFKDKYESIGREEPATP